MDQVERVERLYRRYRREMVRVAEGVLGSGGEAEDAVHEVFLRLAGTRNPLAGRLTEERDVRNYLLAAARNEALHQLRKNALMSGRAFSGDELEEKGDALVACTEEDLSGLLASLESYQDLVEAIRSLPLKYREVLYGRTVSGLSVKELSEQLNRTEDTVRRQLSRARALLRDSLEERK